MTSTPHFPPCPECADDQVEEVLSDRPSGHTLRWTCGHVATVSRTRERHVQLMVTISEGEISHQLQTTLPAEMDICLDDELEVAGRWVRVRRMQTETGDLRAGLMENVKHLWVQAYDQIAIGFSITRGDTTESFDRSYPPETLFVIGRPPPDLPDRLIIRIKTRDRVRRRGSVQARDISRVYLQA